MRIGLAYLPTNFIRSDATAHIRCIGTGCERVVCACAGSAPAGLVRPTFLQPRSIFTRPVLWLISKLLRKAIDRHLQQMRVAALDERQATVG